MEVFNGGAWGRTTGGVLGSKRDWETKLAANLTTAERQRAETGSPTWFPPAPRGLLCTDIQAFPRNRGSGGGADSTMESCVAAPSGALVTLPLLAK